jgi:hypothetical protein
MEVQHHGILFEDGIIFEITGLNKAQYQSELDEKYTSIMDIVKDVHSEKDYSIKVSKDGKGVGCADIIRFISNFKEGFTMIVGCWKQVNSTTKKFYKIYEFDITKDHYDAFWGGLTSENLTPFVNYVKSIEHGKAAQKDNQKRWKEKRAELYETHGRGIVSIDAKIDSKTQRRVQCSIKLEDLIQVCNGNYNEYTDNFGKIQLPYETASKPRSFKRT